MTKEDAELMRDALERVKLLCRYHKGGCDGCPMYNEYSMIECLIADVDEMGCRVPGKWSF